MQIQNSFKENARSCLYVVPTPIGNLEDMTFRAINVLKDVDLILAEDTRHTRKLLNHFQIKNETMSYHEHNRNERIPYAIEELKAGKNIALVSDAGMPAISDPGYELVHEAINNDLSVIVLPGANAALCALVGSGLDTKQYLFYGFLQKKKQEKMKQLQSLREERATLVFYESPYRVKDTLQAMKEQFGNRHISIARELTKMYEQYIRGTIDEVLQWLKEHEIKGECSIVVSGATEQAASEDEAMWWATLSLEQHVAYYEKNKSVSHKEAIKLAAADRGLTRRVVYNELHVKGKDD